MGNRAVETEEQLTVEEYMSTVSEQRLGTSEQKAKVEKYIELRKAGKTVAECCTVVNIARDTVFKWAKNHGYGDLKVYTNPNYAKETRTKRNKSEPTMATIAYPQTPPTTPAPPPVAAKPSGKVVVIVGDANSVKEALSAAFNVMN